MTVVVTTKEDLEALKGPVTGKAPERPPAATQEVKQSPEQLPDIDNELIEKRVTEILAKYGISEKQQRDSRKETVDLQPDADDILENPNHYFVYSTNFKLWSYKSKGVEYPTPYKRPIRFLKLYRYEVPSRGGKGTEALSIAMAIVWSKRESDYIEKCPFYNIKIYKSIADVSSADKEFSEKKTQINSHIAKLDDAQVMRECNAAGLKPSESLVNNRNILLMHRIKQAESLQEENRKRVAGAKKVGLEVMKEADVDTKKFIDQGSRETLVQ